nr:helix-turn-helix transcriptional regulator [Kofleriaceae bacterium]
MDRLARELATIQLDGAPGLAGVLPELRAYLELDSVLALQVDERATGWGVAQLDSDGLPNASRFHAALTTALARAPRRFWCFDPVAPESDQRDRAVDTREVVGDAAYRSSPVVRDVLAPLRLDDHRELRALVCDGGTLLAWVGGFHDGPLHATHRDRLAAILPALRRRFAADRALRTAATTTAALAAALEHHTGAAIVVGPRGELAHANRAARARLDTERDATVATLTDARADVERVPLRAAGLPPHTLVLFRSGDDEQAAAARCERAASRWQLTARQREVLALLVRGRANASIAAELGVGERAVELHVTAILDRASVNSRASLVALVLGALVV